MNNDDREMQHLNRLVEKAQREALGLGTLRRENREERPMKNPVKNFYTVEPFELEPGDVLLCVVKLVVMDHKSPTGRQQYRLYRCAYPADTNCMYEEDVPQGSRIFPEHETFGKELFPVVSGAGMEIE
jgi:hypothetical protein